MQLIINHNPAYYAPKVHGCTHVLTGRTTFANCDHVVYVSCGRCGATLDVLPSDTERQAYYTALSEQRDPGCAF